MNTVTKNEKKENKQTKYRIKQMKQGRCPRCGTPCAPYYICLVHRDKRRTQYTLGRMVVTGQLIQKDGKYIKAEEPKTPKGHKVSFL